METPIKADIEVVKATDVADMPFKCKEEIIVDPGLRMSTNEDSNYVIRLEVEDKLKLEKSIEEVKVGQ